MIVSNKSIITYVVFLISFIVIGFGFSYAFFSEENPGNKKAANDKVATESRTLEFSDNTDILINDLTNYQKITKEITVTNNTAYSETYSLIWTDIKNGFANRENLIYIISCVSTNGICPSMDVSHKSPLSADKTAIFSNINIPSGATHTFKIVFTVEGVDSISTFSAKVIITKTSLANNVNADILNNFRLTMYGGDLKESPKAGNSEVVIEKSGTYTLVPNEGYSTLDAKLYCEEITHDLNGSSVSITKTMISNNERCKLVFTKEFHYTGDVQNHNILLTGKYKFEVWGAQGGSYDETVIGGKGGYSIGTINLSNDTNLFVYVGGQGLGGSITGARSGGFNGGGSSNANATYSNASGGGATDIRVVTDSLYARVIVAGGGGGSGNYNTANRYNGGDGGGATAGNGGQYSTSYRAGLGGSATAGGTSYYGTTANSTTYGTLATFGVGASYKGTYTVTGGGGGWYGGGYGDRASAGGGSGYVYTSTTASNCPTGCLLNSSYYLTVASTIAGNVEFLSPTGTSETGHIDDGYARITYMGS